MCLNILFYTIRYYDTGSGWNGINRTNAKNSNVTNTDVNSIRGTKNANITKCIRAATDRLEAKTPWIL